MLERVGAIELPVFVANGRQRPDDPAALLAPAGGLLPDARITIYPDSAHGFLFQHHEEFAADVHAFLQASR